MHHLRKTRHGAYTFRQAIPRALRPTIGKTELLIGLRTKDPTQARMRAYILSVEVLALFQELREMPKQPGEPDIGNILENLKQGQGRKYEAEFHPSGSLARIKTDGTAEDHERAIELAKVAASPAKFQPMNDEASRLLKGLRHYNIEAKPLSEAFDAYDKQHSVRKTKSWPKHLRPIVLDFISWIKEKHPRITVNKIDGNDVLAWQDVLIARGNDGATVQKKINTLDSFFRWCQSRKWLPDGENSRPTSGMSRKAVSEPWKSYEEPEIRQMFKPDVYLEHNRRLPHKYWLPLLGLYGGARLNEFCRLRACDFREIEGVKVIDYTHASTKNLNSKRIVPVHPGLLDLGLLDYVEAVKKQCGEMATIFPYLADPQKAGGGRFAHYADKTGITDERQVYHSFRHTIAKKMASAGFPPHYAEYYTGHLSHKIHYTVYAGQDKPQKHFAELLAKVSMPVDISALRLPAEHWQQCLKTEIEKFQRRTSTDARKRRLLAHQRGLQKQKKQ